MWKMHWGGGGGKSGRRDRQNTRFFLIAAYLLFAAHTDSKSLYACVGRRERGKDKREGGVCGRERGPIPTPIHACWLQNSPRIHMQDENTAAAALIY